VCGLLWAGGAAALYLAMRAGLVAEFDRALEAQARALAALTSEEDGRYEMDFDATLMPSFSKGAHPDSFQLWLPDGTPWQSRPAAEGGRLPQLAGALDRPQFANLTLPDGRPGRAVGLRFVPPAEDAPEAGAQPRPALALVVARHRAELDDRLRLLATTLLLVGGGTAAAAACVVPFLVGRGLRPLSSLAARTAAIDASALGVRFDTSLLPAELLPIATRLNELLERLQASFDRERRFSADVAHELRTPIAELRSVAEVALKWPDDPPATSRALHDALEIALQMEAITASLLALARCEAGLQEVARTPVSVAEQVEASWRPLAEKAGQKGLTVSFHVPEQARCAADPSLLQLVLTNLMTNAVEYAPREGAIECRAEVMDGHCLLTVSNTVRDLTPSDIPQLFERFWRKDAARTSGAGSGLGLALALAYARAMRMEIKAEWHGPDTLAIQLRAARA